MKEQLRNLGLFSGFFILSLAGAAFPVFLAPIVERGSRGINGSIFLSHGLICARLVAPVLWALPVLILVACRLSFRFAVFRSAEAMAIMGFVLIGFYLLYSFLLCFPLLELGAMLQ